MQYLGQADVSQMESGEPNLKLGKIVCLPPPPFVQGGPSKGRVVTVSSPKAPEFNVAVVDSEGRSTDGLVLGKEQEAQRWNPGAIPTVNGREKWSPPRTDWGVCVRETRT